MIYLFPRWGVLPKHCSSYWASSFRLQTSAPAGRDASITSFIPESEQLHKKHRSARHWCNTLLANRPTPQTTWSKAKSPLLHSAFPPERVRGLLQPASTEPLQQPQQVPTDTYSYSSGSSWLLVIPQLTSTFSTTSNSFAIIFTTRAFPISHTAQSHQWTICTERTSTSTASLQGQSPVLHPTSPTESPWSRRVSHQD